MCTQSYLHLSFLGKETPVEVAAISDIESTSFDTDELVKVECCDGEKVLAPSKNAKDVGSVNKKTQDQVLQKQYKALLLKQQSLKLERRKLELEVLLLEKKANEEI